MRHSSSNHTDNNDMNEFLLPRVLSGLNRHFDGEHLNDKKLQEHTCFASSIKNKVHI